MISAITALFAVFTSGAGGGIVGGLFAIFNKKAEGKERIELAKISAKRDAADYKDSQAERAHALTILEKNADLGIKQSEMDLRKVESEGDAAADIANMEALGRAQDVLGKLKTTSGMDNFRASIRPGLAVWAAIIFTGMMGWAFWEFKDTIDDETGKQILVGMFATLTFIITSITTFYFVSRRNAPPKS